MAYKKLKLLKKSCSPRGCFKEDEFMYVDEANSAEITALVSGGFVIDTGQTVDASQLPPSAQQGTGVIQEGGELP